MEIISNDVPELSTAIVSFSLDEKLHNRELYNKMREQKIIIKTLPQYNAIRISNHMFTTNKDVDQMIAVLKQALV